MSYKTEMRFNEICDWWDANKSDAKRADPRRQYVFFEKAIHNLMWIMREFIDDQRKSEGRIQGDKDVFSEFPIDYDSIPKQVIAVKTAFGANGERIG